MPPPTSGSIKGGRHLELVTESHYDSSSNISSMVSSSCGSRKLPPPKKDPRVGPLRGGGKCGSQAASTFGAATVGRKRARDPTMASGFTLPQQGEDWKHQVLIYCNSGGGQVCGAGQP